MSHRRITTKQIDKALTGLGYIEEWGNGLIDFVNRYRSLTRIPEPKLEDVEAGALIDKIALLKHEATSKSVYKEKQ